jgi:hypothetical protein
MDERNTDKLLADLKASLATPVSESHLYEGGILDALGNLQILVLRHQNETIQAFALRQRQVIDAINAYAGGE